MAVNIQVVCQGFDIGGSEYGVRSSEFQTNIPIVSKLRTPND